MRKKIDKQHRAYRTKRRTKDWWGYLWKWDDKFIYLEPEE